MVYENTFGMPGVGINSKLSSSTPEENTDWVELQSQLKARDEVLSSVAKQEALKRKAAQQRAFRKANPVATRVDKFGRDTQRNLKLFGKKVRDPVLERVGEFAGVAQRQAPDFSREQMMLQSMFGGGEKIWGLGPESGTQVQINHDLNPSQRGDMGTARLFGF
jgi:hypothetical protein